MREFFVHTCSIYRKAEYETAAGETKISDAPLPVIENAECYLAQINRSYNANQTEAPNQIKYNHKLFLPAGTDVKAGDKIDVTLENGFMKSFLAADSYYYPEHIEVPLMFEGEA